MGKFEKGNPGKPKGAVNKAMKTVKETVLNVFNKLQEDPEVNLEAWAKSSPDEFYKIASKLIPTEVTAAVEHTGGVNFYIPDNTRQHEQPNDQSVPRGAEGASGIDEQAIE